MIINNLLGLKIVALPLAIGYTVFILLMSLVNLKSVPDLGSTFDDKIYHFFAYTLMTLVWYNYFRFRTARNSIVFSAIIALVCGIIVEVLQGTLTDTRTEDIMDVLANSCGILFAIALILGFKKYIVKIN